MSEPLEQGLIETWRGWIGREERRSEALDPEALRRFAAAVGAGLDVEQAQPPLAHWAFFLPVFPDSEIGPDGHPKRGGFLPPVTLPRRMFASSAMTFGAPLVLGEPAEMVSTILDVKHRSGRTGDLVFVEVERVISQGTGVCAREQQTIVYRGAGEATAALVPVAQDLGPDDEAWRPDTVRLFRFSAVTFNSHRIHYDQPYARGEEGYPDLVVHGPFTAAKLHAYATRRLGRPLTRFSFRAVAPIFVDQPVRLTGDPATGAFQAIRCDGAQAMAAEAG
ncbi:FAS1-like dehydratase domain-containing protein [Phenylobacterium aquaticum]|uniref:FAS1-like dehydratase domain-containing protein n=1 Tax=Phenylobacterium aquaticum TaxID=1763816 RepID=UPI001F5C7225|nr:MaoC family dehydratase N-terminal domain-containing protein [Phenylobacterium aquaticum]